jgi:hypothetical protein
MALETTSSRQSESRYGSNTKPRIDFLGRREVLNQSPFVSPAAAKRTHIKYAELTRAAAWQGDRIEAGDSY